MLPIPPGATSYYIYSMAHSMVPGSPAGSSVQPPPWGILLTERPLFHRAPGSSFHQQVSWGCEPVQAHKLQAPTKPFHVGSVTSCHNKAV